MSKKKVLLRGVFINRDTNGEGVLKVGTTLIRVSTVMGILYISTYYTRKEINESFLFEVVQKHEYAYEMCQLQELIIKKQDERWILYLNDEVMGYVEVKKVFLIKEFCFVWDRQKIDQRRQLYE